jgi:hypothetical protein
MAGLPEILALGANNCFARWRNLTVQWWHETRVEAVDQHIEIFSRLHKRSSGPFGALIVVEGNAPLPDQAARRRLDVLAAATMERCCCLAYAFRGTGFAAAASRGIMAAITMTSPGKFPKKVCATVPEALAFMAPHLDEMHFGSPAERVQALEDIRARFETRSRT